MQHNHAAHNIVTPIPPGTGHIDIAHERSPDTDVATSAPRGCRAARARPDTGHILYILTYYVYCNTAPRERDRPRRRPSAVPGSLCDAVYCMAHAARTVYNVRITH